MPNLRKVSGHKTVKILCNKFGFKSLRQKGSHIILIKEDIEKIGCVVPLHKELKIGTLKSILKQAKIDKEEFIKYL